MAAERARLHAVIHGRVQGVGFRDFVATRARSLGLAGFARNLHDGRSVEVVAEGPHDTLQQLLAYVRAGPRASHVDQVDASWTEATDSHADFRITG